MKTISNRDYDILKRSLPIVLSAIDRKQGMKVANASSRLKMLLKKLK